MDVALSTVILCGYCCPALALNPLFAKHIISCHYLYDQVLNAITGWAKLERKLRHSN